MQPTQRFKKTLLAGAFIIGAGNSFYASAETFTVLASGIPDVEAEPVAGFTTLGFGATIKGSIIGGTCIIQGAGSLTDSDMDNDFDDNGSDDTAGGTTLFGSVSGTACVDDPDSTASGSAMIIEIDGVSNSSVSIDIPDVVGTGFTYTPSAQSCYINYDNTAATDSCESLESGSASDVKMSLAFAAETPGAGTDYSQEGTLRMVLAGQITIDAGGIAQGTSVAEDIIVSITYE
jgi:hypothetical protein